MSQRQQLLGMQSMLEHVAREAASSGFDLIATLSGAAAEAAREELVAHDRRNRKSGGPVPTARRAADEKVDIFA